MTLALQSIVVSDQPVTVLSVVLYAPGRTFSIVLTFASLVVTPVSENGDVVVDGDVTTLVVKPKDWLFPAGLVTLRVITVAQLLMLTSIGAMKSLSSAVKEDDDRLLTNTVPKDSHV